MPSDEDDKGNSNVLSPSNVQFEESDDEYQSASEGELSNDDPYPSEPSLDFDRLHQADDENNVGVNPWGSNIQTIIICTDDATFAIYTV